jgi:murein DD-endopeptidase MepM/ murein hydrolase activator NlpD
MAATAATMAMASSVLALSPLGLGVAGADTAGGAQAPRVPLAGGSEYGVTVRALTPAPRPVVSTLTVPSSAPAGRPPRVTLRIDEAGVGTVNAQVAVVSLTLGQRAVTASLGWIHTGRTVVVGWPKAARLVPGSYEVSVRAYDHRRASLLRRAHSSGVATLTITAASPSPKSTGSAPPQSTTPLTGVVPPSTLSPVAGAPSPAQTVPGAMFPVQGTHNFGGPENRFGAARSGHVHQGQDVLTAEGTPVVAPLPGTISSTSYQAGGAGYYVVEHASDGLDFFYAHCMANSTAVGAGQSVSAGSSICKAGQTGDATAPHLHFEIWVGGWQAAGGEPIDPLPYLEAWDR